MVESGIILLKYWLEVSPDEQTRRLESRINDPRKVWKLSDMDLKSYGRWWDYEQARDDMFRATDTSWAPWNVAAHRRQAAGPAQHHQPPAQPDSLRASRASCGRAPGPPEAAAGWWATPGTTDTGDPDAVRVDDAGRNVEPEVVLLGNLRLAPLPGWGCEADINGARGSRGEYAGRRPRRSPADGAALHGDVRAGGGHLAHERVDLGGDPRPQDHGQRCAVCHCPRGVGLGCVHPHQQQDRRPHRPQARLRHWAVGLCRGCPGNDIDPEHHVRHLFLGDRRWPRRRIAPTGHAVADSWQLHRYRPEAGLRDGRRRGRHRRRRGPVARWIRHHVPVLARWLCSRSRDHHRRAQPDPVGPRCPVHRGAEGRRRRRVPLCPRHGRCRARHPGVAGGRGVCPPACRRGGGRVGVLGLVAHPAQAGRARDPDRSGPLPAPELHRRGFLARPSNRSPWAGR